MDLKALISDATERDWETEPPEEPLRMAVVGLGYFGRKVALPAIARADYAEPTVVVSGSADKADSVAEEYDADGLTYEDYHDGAASGAYEAVYVATPNATHLDFVETAADQGKHVVCEKPLEATLDRATELVEATSDADVRLMTAYRMQTTPIVRRARELVDHGAIGEVVRAEGSFNTKPLQSGSPDQWRLDDELAGGGAMPDIGIYPLNTVRFVLDAEPESVWGYTSSPHAPFQDVDEHVSFTLGFGEGVHATGTASFNAEPASHLRIVGTEGILSISPVFQIQATRTLTLQRRHQEVTITTNTDEVVEEFDYFAHAIRSNDQIEPDGSDGHRDMEIIDAIYESAGNNKTVQL